MRISVSAWDPGYADTGEKSGEAANAKTDLDIEVPATKWEPIGGDGSTPPRVLLVDGVRRLDARVDIAVPGQQPVAGICASYAAGVVECDLNARTTASIPVSRIERGLFSAVPDAGLTAGRTAAYVAHKVRASEPGDLLNAVQDRLTAMEIEVATEAGPGRDDLLVIDGALRRRTHLPRAVGFIKSHQRRYLPDHLAAIIDKLEPGQRTPVFVLGTSWRRHTWYLRLPGGGDGSWAGIARLEAADDLTIAEVVALADTATAVLPRLASVAHKDPRAPQNLTPIAGLERRLRAKLGDPRLLLRGLRTGSRT